MGAGAGGDGKGVQLGSGTIWAANASALHAAMQESLHTRSHCMRTKVLQGGLVDPLQPRSCAGPQAWAVGRVKGIAVANFLPLSCPLGWPMGHEQYLWGGGQAGPLVPQLGKE